MRMRTVLGAVLICFSGPDIPVRSEEKQKYLVIMIDESFPGL